MQHGKLYKGQEIFKFKLSSSCPYNQKLLKTISIRFEFMNNSGEKMDI